MTGLPVNPQFYGDDTRWFVGRVISLSDPLELGRVRVRIFGIHSDNLEDIPEGDLPWAQTIVPVTEGGSSGLGNNLGIREQAQVFGIFLDGKNSQLPIVLGSIPKIENEVRENNRREEVVKKPAAPTASGQTNVEKAFNFFISEDGGNFTVEQACGIIGNLLKESQTGGDINPTALNVPEGSFGIAQWNPARAAGNRLGQLKDFCRQRGYNFRELEPQLEFIKFELFAFKYLGLAKLREAETAADAARAFETYERPAGWTPGGQSFTVENRIAFAEETLEKMET